MRTQQKRRLAPKFRAGFAIVRDQRCPSCEDRGALDLLGRARFNKTYGFFRSMGCETCGGGYVDKRTGEFIHGRIPVAFEESKDPFDTGRGASHVS